MKIAIDVDNTLLTTVIIDGAFNAVLNHDVVALMRAIKALGVADIIVWSGGGKDYAEKMVHRYGLQNLVDQCAGKLDFITEGFRPDITLDDQDMTAGTVNLKLPGDIQATPWMGIW
jgi:hypothetical protein